MRRLLLFLFFCSTSIATFCQVEILECYQDTTLYPPSKNLKQSCGDNPLLQFISKTDSSLNVYIPTSELDKWLPDQYTPIKTINLRFVIIQYDSVDKRNFDLNNTQHVQFLYDYAANANSKLSNLQTSVDPSISSLCDEENRGPIWVPAGSSNTYQDSRIRVRIHEIVERVAPGRWNQDSDTTKCGLGPINNAYKNQFPKDAINVYFTSSAYYHDRWVNQVTTIDTVSRGGCSSRPVREPADNPSILIKSLYPEYYGKCNGGLYVADHPSCDTTCCQWAENAQLLVHEMLHNLGIGHLDTLCPPNYMSNGEGQKNTIYNYQVAQANRQTELSNARNTVYECSAALVDRPFSSDYLFDENQKIYQNLIIEAEATVTVTCELQMPRNGKIIVKPGGKLIVDGGKITSIENDHCGEGFWKGIEVWGTPGQPQSASNCGIAEFKNGAIIEKAVAGVKNHHVIGTNDFWNFGGIIRASNSTFLNNTFGVDMKDFQNFLPTDPPIKVGNLSFFIDCDFITDDDFIAFPAKFKHFISLSRVDGIPIKGCTFINEATSARSDLYGGTGVYSFGAGFQVIPKSTSANAKRSSFSNLHYGVNGIGAGSGRTFIVDQSDFNNIDFAIYVKAVNQVQLTRNVINVGRVLNSGVSTGISLIDASGYWVEHDTLSIAPGMSDEAYGIRVYNSGTASNEVYLNDFSDMQLASIGEAVNRSTLGFTGLEFSCNSMNSNAFDFVITEASGFSSSVQGIKETQGTSQNSAGNTFDPLGSQAESHYKVGVDNSVDYYGHPGLGTPDSLQTTPALFIYQGDANDSSCVSSFSEGGGGNPNDTTQEEQQRMANNNEYKAYDTAYAHAYYSYSQLVDGGSTPQLLIDIQENWTGDAWNMRNELLSHSPLSEDALLEAANSGVLPDAMLLEICLANPDATKSADVVAMLQYEIPNTLDQNSINLIIANWDQETPVGVLKSEMGYLLGKMEVLNNRIIRGLLFSSNGYLADTVEKYLLRGQTLSQKYAYINWLLEQDRDAEADQVMSTVSYSLPEGDYWTGEYNRFEALINQRLEWKQNNKRYDQLETSDKAILETWAEQNDLTGAIAQNLLYHNFGDQFYLPAIDLEAGARKGIISTFNTSPLFSAIVYPNPAENYVSFTFDGTTGEDIMLHIMDANGRLIKKVQVNGRQPVKTISTRAMPSGQYYYKAVSGEAMINGKLTIIK